MSFFRDVSLPAVTAGFVAVLVGFTSSVAIVFAAAQALGANAAQTASWMWALGLGMGLTSLVLSLRYRRPVLTAWSTPGAALIEEHHELPRRIVQLGQARAAAAARPAVQHQHRLAGRFAERFHLQHMAVADRQEKAGKGRGGKGIG